MSPFSKLFSRKSIKQDDTLVSTPKEATEIDNEKADFNEPDLDALDIIAERIFRDGWRTRDWFFPPESNGDVWEENDEVVTGVVIKSRHGPVRSCPSGHPGFQGFENAVAQLNVRVAIKMANKSIDAAMDRYM